MSIIIKLMVIIEARTACNSIGASYCLAHTHFHDKQQWQDLPGNVINSMTVMELPWQLEPILLYEIKSYSFLQLYAKKCEKKFHFLGSLSENVTCYESLSCASSSVVMSLQECCLDNPNGLAYNGSGDQCSPCVGKLQLFVYAGFHTGLDFQKNAQLYYNIMLSAKRNVVQLHLSLE